MTRYPNKAVLGDPTVNPAFAPASAWMNSDVYKPDVLNIQSSHCHITN